MDIARDGLTFYNPTSDGDYYLIKLTNTLFENIKYFKAILTILCV